MPVATWDLPTTITVLVVWLLGFGVLAYAVMPAAMAALRVDPATPGATFQALRHLAMDLAQLGFTLGLLARALWGHEPRRRGFFALRVWPLTSWLGVALCSAATFPVIHAVHRATVVLLAPGPGSGAGSGGEAAARALLSGGGLGTRALWLIMLALCAPVWEEVMFRGFLLPSLAAHMPDRVALLLSSAAFACMHFSKENFLPLLLLGAVFGQAYRQTLNLLPCIVLHSLWNIYLLYSVCGL